MGIEERKKKEKERLRKKILDAAFSIINEEGYQALTIRRLADRIEYSPRTIYLYYTDKEDLLRAIVEFGFSATVRNLEDNDYYSHLSPEETLKTAIANHIRTAAGNVHYYNTVIHVLQGTDFQPGPFQKKMEQYLFSKLEPYFKREGATPEFTLFFLFASIRGITVELINKRMPESEEELERTIDMVFQFYKNLLNIQAEK